MSNSCVPRIFDKHSKLITYPKLILCDLHDFYSELYSNRDLPDHHVLSDAFLDHCLLPTLSEDSRNNCEGALTNGECFKALQTFKTENPHLTIWG